MNKKYLCVFKGVRSDEHGFRQAMRGLGLDEDFLDRLIAGAPVVVKRDVDLLEARRYGDVLQEAGAMVSIREGGVFAGEGGRDGPGRWRRWRPA